MFIEGNQENETFSKELKMCVDMVLTVIGLVVGGGFFALVVTLWRR